MKILLTFTVLFISCNAKAMFRADIGVSFNSLELMGSTSSSEVEGNIISNNNLNYFFSLKYFLTKQTSMHFKFSPKSYEFDNTKDVIEGDSKLSTQNTEIGLKFIVHPRVALGLGIKQNDVAAFKVNSSNKAQLLTNKIINPYISYDQIIFLGSSMYSGLFVNYEIPASGDDIENSGQSSYGLFAKVFSARVEYTMGKNNFVVGDLDFTTDYSALTLAYLF